MRTINLPYGITYLLDKDDVEIDTDRFFIQQDEFGQFYATEKQTGDEMHIPRTTAVASMTIEASRFTSHATKFGQEIHEQTEQGIKNAYNRHIPLSNALYKEQRFIHIGKILFTGTIDLVFEKYIGDVKTGDPSKTYYYQLLGYAYALGYSFAESFYYSPVMGAYSHKYYFMDEQYHLWEQRYQEWVEGYNSSQRMKDKEVIMTRMNDRHEEPLLEEAKGLVKVKSLKKIIDKRVDEVEDKCKSQLSMLLTGKKLEIYDDLTDEKVVLSTTKKGVLTVRGSVELDMQDIQEILFKKEQEEEYEVESL